MQMQRENWVRYEQELMLEDQQYLPEWERQMQANIEALLEEQSSADERLSHILGKQEALLEDVCDMAI